LPGFFWLPRRVTPVCSARPLLQVPKISLTQ
jgi:hypothetical protein